MVLWVYTVDITDLRVITSDNKLFGSYMNHITLTSLFFQTIQHMGFESKVIRFDDTWDSIEVIESYEKPPKEEFEAKLQELIDAQPLKELRTKRNKRLTACDWVTLKAYSTQKVVPKVWCDYMQALRDLPTATEDPANPVWPVAPTS